MATSLQPLRLSLLLPLLLSFSLFLSLSSSLSSENQTVISVLDAYPKTRNPKSYASEKKKICYPQIGCFSLEGAFAHHRSLPQHPDKVGVKLRLNTRATTSDVNATRVIDWRQPQSIADSTFDPKKPTVIAVHGFLGHIDKGWLNELMQVSLELADVNFVRVGWSRGAQTIDYPQAAADTRLVGAEIALFVADIRLRGANVADIWLIGHSLGAHVMSYVGRRNPGLGRITGLDPAEPYFEGEHTDARLDPSDADFVDVIHTDVNSIYMLGFGSAEPMGHVDYYPNGGKNQPGCDIGLSDHIDKNGVINGTKQFVVCNHERSWKLLIESIRAKVQGRTCVFKSHPCEKYEDFLKEECRQCDERLGCPILGPDSLATRPPVSETLVKTFLLTRDSPPFCASRFLDIEADLPDGFKKDRGQIFFKIKMSNGESFEQEISATNKDDLEPNNSIHRLLVKKNEFEIGDIKDIGVRFKHYWSITDPGTWPIWGKSKIRFSRASVAPYDDDVDEVFEEERRVFCLEGEEAFELVDAKDDEWTQLSFCG